MRHKTPIVIRSILIAGTLAFALSARIQAQVAPPADAPPAYGVTALIQESSKPWDKRIVLEGFVTAVCPRSGKKAWLHDTNSEAAGTVRVERTGQSAIFEKDAIGKTIRVTGTLRELRIDAAYLDSWESRVKGSNTTVEKKDNCTEKCEENQSVDAALKRIKTLRAQVAREKNGYLSAFWVDAEKWEVAGVKAGQ